MCYDVIITLNVILTITKLYVKTYIQAAQKGLSIMYINPLHLS